MRPLNNLTRAIIKPVVRNSPHWLSATLILEWENIVGSQTAKRLVPLKVTAAAAGEGKTGKTRLSVSCSAAAAVQLPYQTAAILTRINSYFGREVIHEITAKNGRTDTKTARLKPVVSPAGLPCEIRDTISSVAGEELQEALTRLACRVLAADNGK